MTRFPNFITAQIWFGTIALAWGYSILTGNLSVAVVGPWIGALVGIAVNEALPGHMSEGIRVVPEGGEEP